MKKRMLFMALAWLCGWIHQVRAQGFSMDSFTADIYLQKEGYFDVVEKYDVTFLTPKHGLFRDFITKFDFQDDNGKRSKRRIYISDISVPGQSFETFGASGSFYSERARIIIGDKNVLVNGQQHYEVRYRVKNALIFSKDQVALYWNIKPDGWMTVFQKVHFTIHGPDGSQMTPENCFVYAGDRGVTTPSTAFDYDYEGTDFTATAHKDLVSVPGQSITVLVKLPARLITEVDFSPLFWERYKFLGLLLLLLGLLAGWIIWRVKASRVIPVTSYYPPEGMDPAMAGVLVDNLTNVRDVTCLLPYWASNGIIRMEVIEKGERSLTGDLKLIKLKELPHDAEGYEHNLFQKIFLGLKDAVLVSSLRGILGEPMRLVTLKAWQYYTNKCKWPLRIIVLGSFLWAFFCIIFLPQIMQKYVDINQGGFIAFTVLNFIFFFIIFPAGLLFVASRYRVKNEEGKRLTAELLGFRNFIKMAELQRIKVLLEEDPAYFEKTMPYAVAFGMLGPWASKFDQLGVSSPDWYRSTSNNKFSLHSFSTSFNSSMAIAKTSMVISPSSGSGSSHSGGGSSGGGAGSGGGGSW